MNPGIRTMKPGVAMLAVMTCAIVLLCLASCGTVDFSDSDVLFGVELASSQGQRYLLSLAYKTINLNAMTTLSTVASAPNTLVVTSGVTYSKRSPSPYQLYPRFAWICLRSQGYAAVAASCHDCDTSILTSPLPFLHRCDPIFNLTQDITCLAIASGQLTAAGSSSNGCVLKYKFISFSAVASECMVSVSFYLSI